MWPVALVGVFALTDVPIVTRVWQGKLGSMKYTVFGLGDSHYWGKVHASFVCTGLAWSIIA
eukprot:4511518-Amphidinium_carterae.1